jgi:hypothetical protein
LITCFTHQLEKVVEIVSIWKRSPSTDELEKELHSVGGTSGKIFVEIRWFYEQCEIVGFHQKGSLEDSDELFETDHLDVIDASTSILAPANIKSDPESLAESPSIDCSSVQPFFCRRFWSTTRKSLIPCGGQAGRQKRAWLYSKHLTVEMQRKVETPNRPLSIIHQTPATGIKTEWRNSFEHVIRKMTLKEASKGAYERGETLVGREKELQQLLSFFRSAIRGEAGPGGLKSSIFLAGPPGVGKVSEKDSQRTRFIGESAHSLHYFRLLA